MKLQNFAIIFALIAIPLILVLTYYIQLQVDTVALQNKYDAMLLNSVNDAVSSFEINTANEDLSSVSDSLRTIIEASNNVFFNTLSTNLGLSNASRAYVEPYIPAILYTLYDGYYISSPTQVPEVLTDPEERAVTVGDLGVDVDGTDYIYTHTTNEEAEKCKECSSAKTKGNLLPHDVRGDIKELSYTKTGDDYGQLLYLKEEGNPNKYTTSIKEAKKTTKNVLKTYMPYSARYMRKNGDTTYFDITVIYTLDNYITIEGTRDNVYYAKSGYLIPENVLYYNDLDKNVIAIENNDVNLLYYSQEDAETYIKNHPVSITIGENEASTEIVSGLNRDGSNTTRVSLIHDINDSETIEEIDVQNTYENLTNTLTQLNNQLESCTNKLNNYRKETDREEDIEREENNIETTRNNINDIQYELDKMSAVIYYVKAQIFSNWVYNNFLKAEDKDGDENYKVKESDIVEISEIDYNTKNNSEQMIYDFKSSSAEVFNTDIIEEQKDYAGVAEIPVNSSFYSHKLNVIRNSIQYNLNLAMSTYNEQTSNTYQYEMPIIQNEEWDKILNNVSVVAFMQGYPCKLKTYNNYKIVSSTNNEIAVSPKNIFYVPKENFNDEQSEYHRIDCDKLPSSEEYMSFSSKEVKYDKTSSSDNSRYLYDHKNFACYDCVNDGNYIERKVDIFNIKEEDSKKNEKLNKLRAYYIAIGKERNNLYKMNAIENSHGYEVIYDDRVDPMKKGESSLNIEDIKQIEIILGTIKTSNIKENLRYDYAIRDGANKIQIGDNFAKPNSISSNEPSNITLILNLNPDSFATNKNQFSFDKMNKSSSLIVTNKNEAQSTTYLSSPGDKKESGITDDTIFQDAIKYIRVIYK